MTCPPCGQATWASVTLDHDTYIALIETRAYDAIEAYRFLTAEGLPPDQAADRVAADLAAVAHEDYLGQATDTIEEVGP